MAGKGDKRRPRSVSQDKWDANYNKAFKEDHGKRKRPVENSTA